MLLAERTMNYCTQERHDNAWTTLQPSHESQTHDDDALHLTSSCLSQAAATVAALHSTAANATLDSVIPRRGSLNCKKATPEGKTSTPTPTPTP